METKIKRTPESEDSFAGRILAALPEGQDRIEIRSEGNDLFGPILCKRGRVLLVGETTGQKNEDGTNEISSVFLWSQDIAELVEVDKFLGVELYVRERCCLEGGSGCEMGLCQALDWNQKCAYQTRQ